MDSDVITRNRPESIEYLKDTYGEQNVSQIITFQTYGVKTIVQEALKMAGGSSEEAIKLSKSLEDVPFDYLEKVYNTPEEVEDIDEISDAMLSKYHKNYEDLTALMERDKELEPFIRKGVGLIKGVGTHAAGVIISKHSMRGRFPTEESLSKKKILDLLSISMEDVGYFNLLKLDVLGLKTLQVIKDAMDMIGLSYEFFDSQEYTDKDVYEFLRKGNTHHIFQLEKPMPRKFVQDFFADNIIDLSTVSACNRPGALLKQILLGNKNMPDIYKETVDNGGVVKTSLGVKEADEIVKESGGAAVYQEQIQKIGQVIGGYTLGGADLRIRKIIGNVYN